MTERATPPRQILLAYALLLSVVASTWFVAGQPLKAGLERGDTQIAALQSRIDALRQAAARDLALQPDVARQQINRLRRFIHQATIEAETLEVGGSLLQRQLTGIIEQHGGEPGNIHVATNPDSGTVAVSARFAADLPSVADIIFELAQARPLIFTDLLSIRRRDHYLEAGDWADNGDLIVQLDVSAFWRRPAANESR